MSFLEVYHSALAGGLREDAAQLDLAQRLQELGDRVVEINRTPSWQRSIRRVWHWKDWDERTKGLYVWGGVGRGKTLLVDMFFEWLPIKEKRRQHFHHFMLLVHRQLEAHQGQANPLQEIARQFRDEVQVLCFDEFSVSDIGDAMILAELLQALFTQEMIFVATSNIVPRRLYENGLQRELFKPAISLLETHTSVVEMGGSVDYRLETLQQSAIYRTTYPATEEDIQEDQLVLLHRSELQPTEILINDRPLQTVFEAEGIAGFTFKELCDTPRNAADYIELARLFHTFVLYDIPVLDENSESSARRFIALIDEFYDHHVNLIFYAEAPINSLYRGDQLKVPIQRTISRVIEMQSDDYLSIAHQA